MEIIREGLLEPRDYQLKIAKVASHFNTLVVLPTGLGKTIIAILVAANRLKKYPGSKILMLAPTRPLCVQHKKSFEKFTTIKSYQIVAVTGKFDIYKRKRLYNRGKIVTATPQCILNDIRRGYFDLSNVSLLVIDEAHRAVGNYAYVDIAKIYVKSSKFPLILGLTASPGGRLERIEEVRKNLFIEKVEIRSESDRDVRPYVKRIKKEWIYVELPKEMQVIRNILEDCLGECLEWLKEHGFITSKKITKKLLLILQKEISEKISEGKTILYSAAKKVAEALKYVYALELLETQGISPLYEFLKELNRSNKKSDRSITKDPRIIFALRKVEKLIEKGIEHPKMDKLIQIVKELVLKDPKIKIIVFANYRATVDRINRKLIENGLKSNVLIGQASKKTKGLSQREQVEILRRFARREFNVLVATSIGEEGLDIVDTDVAIFYEAVPSEIRMIQRRGRVGRQKAGKLIILLTKGTMDEAFYWAAFHKLRKMRSILYEMKERSKGFSLLDWTG